MSVVNQCKTVFVIYYSLTHTYFLICNSISVLLGSVKIILSVSVYLDSVLGTLQLCLCSRTSKQVFMVEKTFYSAVFTAHFLYCAYHE
jgi:hypothetical protein